MRVWGTVSRAPCPPSPAVQAARRELAVMGWAGHCSRECNALNICEALEPRPFDRGGTQATHDPGCTVFTEPASALEC